MDIKPLLIKSAFGIVGIGGLGFAAHKGYNAINSQPQKTEKNGIQNKLKAEGYTILTKGSSHFTEILANYRTVTAAKNTLKFGTFTGNKPDGETKEPADILWEHCESALSSDVTDEIFNKARKWCVVPIEVSSVVTAKNLRVLGETTEGSADQAKWDAKVKKYRTAEGVAKVFQSLEVGTGDTAVTVEQRNAIKAKCDIAGKIKNHTADYENNLSNFENWCTDKQ